MIKDINPFGVRMPPDIKAELELLAETNRRSLNAEIVVRLEESIKREKQSCIGREELREILQEELSKAKG